MNKLMRSISVLAFVCLMTACNSSKSVFMKGCLDPSGDNEDICECVYDKTEEKFGKEQMKEVSTIFSNQEQQGVVADYMLNVSMPQCLAEHGQF